MIKQTLFMIYTITFNLCKKKYIYIYISYCKRWLVYFFVFIVCVLAEWVRVGIWNSWFTPVEGWNSSRNHWNWSPCLFASCGHSGKSSNLFSSATQSCLVLCCSLDGQLISWWESDDKLLQREHIGFRAYSWGWSATLSIFLSVQQKGSVHVSTGQQLEPSVFLPNFYL